MAWVAASCTVACAPVRRCCRSSAAGPWGASPHRWAASAATTGPAWATACPSSSPGSAGARSRSWPPTDPSYPCLRWAVKPGYLHARALRGNGFRGCDVKIEKASCALLIDTHQDVISGPSGFISEYSLIWGSWFTYLVCFGQRRWSPAASGSERACVALFCSVDTGYTWTCPHAGLQIANWRKRFNVFFSSLICITCFWIKLCWWIIYNLHILPSQRVQTHETDGPEKVDVIIGATQNVDHSTNIYWDISLTCKRTWEFAQYSAKHFM